MLVLGGTHLGVTSNRMQEDACELVPCLDKGYHAVFISATKSQDLGNIENMLRQMNKVGVNIVGSRGYVYSTLKLADCVGCVRAGSNMNINLFPRTAGLRKSIITASQKEL